jgi:2-keto-3-deoxy-L-rhamnonate aldolase RhmA
MNRFVQQTNAGNEFLGRLRDGRTTLMLGIRGSRGTDIVRVAHSTGHHAVLVDVEHSTMSLDVVASLCAAAADLGVMPFVRTPEREYGSIGRLLDGGALGIVAPD